MSTDFRKQFENPSGVGVPRPVEESESSFLSAPAPVAETAAAPTPVSQTVLPDGTAPMPPGGVSFPLRWTARIGGYGGIAGAFGFVAYTAINGDPERDLLRILIGCAAVLIGLCFMPATIVVDERGVHQHWVMGLYEYSIKKSSLKSFEATTRAKLRRAGKLRFEWRRERGDLSDELEDVVYVASRYGGRYILHSEMHVSHFGFIETLEKFGVPAHGYENWDKFMEERGFPSGDVNY